MGMPFGKSGKDPKREPPVNMAEISRIMEDGNAYKDMYISRNTFINAVFTGAWGVFAFIAFGGDTDQTELLLKAGEVKEYLPVSCKGLFVFFLSGKKNGSIIFSM